MALWSRQIIGWVLPCMAIAGCNSSVSNVNRVGEPSPTSNPSPGDRPQVIATFLPMYLFTKAVAGDAAEVKLLIAPGTEVHEYQSTPADVQAIAQADVLVENGLGMELFLQDLIRNAQNSQLKVVNASQSITTIDDPQVTTVSQTSTDDHGHNHAHDPTHNQDADHGAPQKSDEHHGHTHAEGNPHVWLDPVLAKRQVENIRDGLIAADPQGKAIYTANAAAYIQQLTELDRQFRQQLQPFRGCTFVAFHDAYPYLAQRYELQQKAVVKLPEDSLTPAAVQNVVTTVKQAKVTALFGEPGVDNRLLQSMSQDLQLELRPLDPLEAGTPEPSYYFTAMKQNLQELVSACQSATRKSTS